VEEPVLLLAMQRIIGRIQIKNDLLRRPFMRLQEQVDQESPNRNRIVADWYRRRRLVEAQDHA
jgi:hypothetical protein